MNTYNIGILAIQGAVEEHAICMRKLGCNTKEIRTPIDLEGVDAIILPGGESTAMAIVGEECGLFPALQDWIKSNKPIWGTCAGLILLSDYAIKKASCGQSLLGGLDVHVCRNYFGSQIYSSELDIILEQSIEDDKLVPPKGIFIRAPAILKVGSDVKVLASANAKPHRNALNEVIQLLEEFKNNNINTANTITNNNILPWIATLITNNNIADSDNDIYLNVAVAVQQNNILATAFHPELTNDLRWHKIFLNIIKSYYSE